MGTIRDLALAKVVGGGGGGGISVESLAVTENGTYTAPSGKAYSPVTVNVPQGGGGGVASNAVNFRDYDGTIVASYSAADFANLTALPDNPSHDGLTAQGWNWSLADSKAYVAKYGRLEIGQMYITTDGKTHVHIHLEQGRTSPMLGCCPNGTVDVDWGDGTAYDTLTGTSTSTVKWTPNHAYAAPGDYVIKLTVTGSMGFYGKSAGNQYSGLLRYSSSADSRNRVYQNAIKMVEIGSGVTSIGNYAFYYCYSLVGITIPNSVTSIGDYALSNCYILAGIAIPDSVTGIGEYAFGNCYSLAGITIPNSVTSIDNNTFYSDSILDGITIPDSVTSISRDVFHYCYSLSGITIPDSVTSISSDAFNNCNCLVNITIPDSVKSIGSNAFYYCYGVAEIHFKPETPPTVVSSNAFNGIPTDCKIYVPTGSLSVYTGADNYPSSSTYTYVEE